MARPLNMPCRIRRLLTVIAVGRWITAAIHPDMLLGPRLRSFLHSTILSSGIKKPNRQIITWSSIPRAFVFSWVGAPTITDMIFEIPPRIALTRTVRSIRTPTEGIALSLALNPPPTTPSVFHTPSIGTIRANVHTTTSCGVGMSETQDVVYLGLSVTTTRGVSQTEIHYILWCDLSVNTTKSKSVDVH